MIFIFFAYPKILHIQRGLGPIAFGYARVYCTSNILCLDQLIFICFHGKIVDSFLLRWRLPIENNELMKSVVFPVKKTVEFLESIGLLSCS